MGARAASWTLAAALAVLAHPPPAAASELKVHSPAVELGEFNFEWNGLATIDREGSPNNARRTQTFELGYAVLPFWHPEIEFERETVEGRDKWSEITFENTFQLTPTGKYFADLGLFAAYSQSLLADEPSAVTAGPILRKTVDVFGLDTRHTLNLFLSREIGPDSANGVGFAGAWQSVWRASPLFAPGFEAYSFIDDLGRAGRYNTQYHSIGPVIVGGGEFERFGALRYEIGYQFGLSSGAPRGAIRWKLEYEIAF
jgi:hypothetical protein